MCRRLKIARLDRYEMMINTAHGELSVESNEVYMRSRYNWILEIHNEES